jgi:putative ABC transport system permease protein
MKRKHPPPLAVRILERMLDSNVRYAALGDFEERYFGHVEAHGLFKAQVFYWIQIVILLPPFLKNLVFWSIEMLTNYFKVAFRVIKRHKGFSLINILGLAIGMASCLLIFLYVQDELSYDRYNKNADRIYRAGTHLKMQSREMSVASVCAPMAKALVDEFPEVENAVRFREGSNSYLFKYEDKSYREDRVVFSEPSFFDIFSIPLLKGNPSTALDSPYTLVLGQKTAEKFFGSTDPVGKTLTVDDIRDYEVTGVFEDIPHNSHFHFDVIASLSSLEESRDPSWFNMNFPTYMLLRKDTDYKALEAKLSTLLPKYVAPQVEAETGKSLEEYLSKMNIQEEFFMQPLLDIHLGSGSAFLYDFEAGGDIKYIYIFTAIALFILVIASINFMNLSTARSWGRAKEVGVRKVLGSFRKDLITQFLTESLLFSIISLAIAVVIAWIMIPFFNSISEKEMVLSDLNHWFMIKTLIGMALFMGLLAGSYPAFFISAFRPINILKDRMKIGFKAGPFRSGLVVFQFTASIILIIGTLVIFNQLRYIQHKKLGFEKEQVLILNKADLLGKQAEVLKNEMLRHPQIINATMTSFLPVPSGKRYMPLLAEGETDTKKRIPISMWPVDYDYIDTLRMKIVEGRNFSREFSTDSAAAIINQRAVKHFGFEAPLGKRLVCQESSEKGYDTYTIVGVVEDFHFDSLRNSIEPLVLFLGQSHGLISFRIQTEDMSGTIALLRREWEKFLPDEPFEYSFMDERFDNMYRAEKRVGQIFGIFAGLAIFIGCLGLFGLASFTAERRTKEIGIRKILGASVPKIVGLLVREFLILVCIANLVAWPIAYFMMRRWLEDFAYRAAFGLSIFLIAGTFTLLVSLTTVGFLALRAALSNPALSLRYE